MTAIRYVTEGQMLRETGMKALGYAFPDEDEILIRKGLPKEVELEVRAHEAEHIEKGEEGPFLGGLLGVGASLLGGFFGSKSSDKATKAQTQASQDSIAFQRESRDMALAYQKPYRDASYAATAALMDLTGLSRGGGRAIDIAQVPQNTAEKSYGGGGVLSGIIGRALAGRVPSTNATTQGTGSGVPDLSSYDPYQFQADPGYEFRINEGMKALERGAAARGGLLSGGFARKSLRYAQDYASNEYQNVYNRIANIAGFGQAATNSSASAIMNTGTNVGNAMINAGEARASGYMAQGNAWSNAINEIAKADRGSIFGGQNGS